MAKKGFDYKTFTVAGNATIKIPVSGNLLACESSTGKFVLRTDSGSKLIMRTGSSFGGTDDTAYGFIEITDLTGSNNTITLIHDFGQLYLSDNQTVTAIVSGTPNVSDTTTHSKLDTLETTANDIKTQATTTATQTITTATQATEISARLGDETSSKETDPDAASANGNALLRGIMQTLQNQYNDSGDLTQMTAVNDTVTVTLPHPMYRNDAYITVAMGGATSVSVEIYHKAETGSGRWVLDSTKTLTIDDTQHEGVHYVSNKFQFKVSAIAGGGSPTIDCRLLSNQS